MEQETSDDRQAMPRRIAFGDISAMLKEGSARLKASQISAGRQPEPLARGYEGMKPSQAVLTTEALREAKRGLREEEKKKADRGRLEEAMKIAVAERNSKNERNGKRSEGDKDGRLAHKREEASKLPQGMVAPDRDEPFYGAADEAGKSAELGEWFVGIIMAPQAHSDKLRGDKYIKDSKKIKDKDNLLVAYQRVHNMAATMGWQIKVIPVTPCEEDEEKQHALTSQTMVKGFKDLSLLLQGRVVSRIVVDNVGTPSRLKDYIWQQLKTTYKAAHFRVYKKAEETEPLVAAASVLATGERYLCILAWKDLFSRRFGRREEPAEGEREEEVQLSLVSLKENEVVKVKLKSPYGDFGSGVYNDPKTQRWMKRMAPLLEIFPSFVKRQYARTREVIAQWRNSGQYERPKIEKLREAEKKKMASQPRDYPYLKAMSKYDLRVDRLETNRIIPPDPQIMAFDKKAVKVSILSAERFASTRRALRRTRRSWTQGKIAYDKWDELQTVKTAVNIMADAMNRPDLQDEFSSRLQKYQQLGQPGRSRSRERQEVRGSPSELSMDAEIERLAKEVIQKEEEEERQRERKRVPNIKKRTLEDMQEGNAPPHPPTPDESSSEEGASSDEQEGQESEGEEEGHEDQSEKVLIKVKTNEGAWQNVPKLPGMRLRERTKSKVATRHSVSDMDDISNGGPLEQATKKNQRGGKRTKKKVEKVILKSPKKAVDDSEYLADRDRTKREPEPEARPPQPKANQRKTTTQRKTIDMATFFLKAQPSEAALRGFQKVMPTPIETKAPPRQ